MCLMLISTLSLNAQEKAYDWSRLMDAIIQVESEGKPNARSKDGKCVGVLQITKGLVAETNKILKMKGSSKRYTPADRWNPKKSKEMFVILQEHFNKDHNIEKAIKWWNLGFYSKNLNKGNGYYDKVMKHYNKMEAK